MPVPRRLPSLRRFSWLPASLLLGACASEAPEVSAVYDVDGYRVEQEVADHYQRGLQNLEMGRYGLALDDLRRALRTAGDPVPVLNAIGVGYGQLGRYEIAVGYYERALALEPASVQTLNNLARALLAQGKPEQALEHLLRIEGEGQGEPVVLANLDAAAAALAASHGAGQQADGSGEGQDSEDGAGLPAAWVVRATEFVQTLLTSPGIELAVAEGGSANANVDHVAWRAAAFVAPETAGAQWSLLPTLVPSDPGPAAAETAWPEAAGFLPGVPWVSATPVTTITVEPLPPTQSEAPVAEAVSESSRAVPPVALVAPLAGLLVEVANGTGRNRMAARMGRWLGSRGLGNLVLTNDQSFSHSSSVLFYRPDMREAALRLARALPLAVTLEPRAELYVDLRLLLGADLLSFDQTLLLEKEEAI